MLKPNCSYQFQLSLGTVHKTLQPSTSTTVFYCTYQEVMGDSRKEAVHGIIPLSGPGCENRKLRLEPPAAAGDQSEFQKLNKKIFDILDLIREKTIAKQIVPENVYAKK